MCKEIMIDYVFDTHFFYDFTSLSGTGVFFGDATCILAFVASHF
jgi:hypothetical protein